MLTRKQKELLMMIQKRLTAEGIPPSFEEMKEALGLRSKSGVHRLIMGLEERGFIRRLPHRARALEVVRAPDMGGEPSLGKGALLCKGIAEQEKAAAPSALPFYGRIAAGTPIAAISDVHAHVDVPPDLLFPRKNGGKGTGEHYVLEVTGDSMIEAGIMDGDRVVIRRADTADNGRIVVALVDDEEATLKYFERRKEGIALIPANARYETRVLPSSRIKVQGVLAGLMRRY